MTFHLCSCVLSSLKNQVQYVMFVIMEGKKFFSDVYLWYLNEFWVAFCKPPESEREILLSFNGLMVMSQDGQMTRNRI